MKTLTLSAFVANTLAIRQRQTHQTKTKVGKYGCQSAFVETHRFSPGEKNIGRYGNIEACVEAAKSQCPDFDLVNMQSTEIDKNSNVSACFCQKSGGLKIEDYVQPNIGWEACRIRESASKTTPTEQDGRPVGCDGQWYRTDKFTAGEKNLGLKVEISYCLRDAKQECPDHDLVSIPWGELPNGFVMDCKCQHSNNADISQGVSASGEWGTCKFTPNKK